MTVFTIRAGKDGDDVKILTRLGWTVYGSFLLFDEDTFCIILVLFRGLYILFIGVWPRPPMDLI